MPTIALLAIFVFHTDDVWLNLHQFLYVLGRHEAAMPDRMRRATAGAPVDADQGLAALPPDEQRAWREAVTFYAQDLSKLDAVFDERLIRAGQALAAAGNRPTLAGSGVGSEGCGDARESRADLPQGVVARARAGQSRVGAIGRSGAQDEVLTRMQTWSRALGVTCVHCHVEGDFKSAEKPTFEFATRMSNMVKGLNEGRLKAVGGVTCMTCHRGATRPARLPRASWEAIAQREAAVFGGPHEKRSLAMSVYSASLGVDCDHCHDSKDWASTVKPAHAMSRVMIGLFEGLPTYFARERMPVFQCFTCHQGAVKPLR